MEAAEKAASFLCERIQNRILWIIFKIEELFQKGLFFNKNNPFLVKV